MFLLSWLVNAQTQIIQASSLINASLTNSGINGLSANYLDLECTLDFRRSLVSGLRERSAGFFPEQRTSDADLYFPLSFKDGSKKKKKNWRDW